jgi:hypothetical protein
MDLAYDRRRRCALCAPASSVHPEDMIVKRILLTGVAFSFLYLALRVLAAGALGTEFRAEDNKLVGTWKMISATYNGQESDQPKTMLCLKHVTPTHWIWAFIDPATKKITMSAGGTYTIKDDTYVEMPLYTLGQGVEDILEKPQKFTFKIDGNKWHHIGELSSGAKIDEVWEKQSGATAEKGTAP